MALECSFELAEDHVICRVSVQFTVEENAWIFQLIVERCAVEGVNRAFVDITGIEHPEMATVKLIGAHKVKELADVMTEKKIALPRVAIYGVAPFIGNYKPASDFYQVHGLPVRVFDDPQAAKEWLFASDSE